LFIDLHAKNVKVFCGSQAVVVRFFLLTQNAFRGLHGSVFVACSITVAFFLSPVELRFVTIFGDVFPNRFHICCAHELCEEDSHSFDPKINNENLEKAMKTVLDLYSDVKKDQQS